MDKFVPAYRMISSKFPPIDIFEDILDPDDWDEILDLEMAVNPRIKDAIGNIALVKPEHRITGPGATIVMAAFTHINPMGSRFTDATFGAYYASDSFDTSLRERIYHLTRHLRASPHAKEDLVQRVYNGQIVGDFAFLKDTAAPELDPNSYVASQAYARRVKASKDAVVFPSVRYTGWNIAAFRPDIVSIPTQTKHIQFHFDGRQITKYFDFKDEAWSPCKA